MGEEQDECDGHEILRLEYSEVQKDPRGHMLCQREKKCLFLQAKKRREEKRKTCMGPVKI